MINQPFAGQMVWFVFISPYDYKDTEWEDITIPISFFPTPVGVYSSKENIFKTMDLENKEFREVTKNNIKRARLAEGDNTKAINIWQKILDTEHFWQQIPLQQVTKIEFTESPRSRILPKENPEALPKWLKSKRITTMEIWQNQYYYNKIHDGSEAYCFMEVVL